MRCGVGYFCAVFTGVSEIVSNTVKRRKEVLIVHFEVKEESFERDTWSFFECVSISILGTVPCCSDDLSYIAVFVSQIVGSSVRLSFAFWWYCNP